MLMFKKQNKNNQTNKQTKNPRKHKILFLEDISILGILQSSDK